MDRNLPISNFPNVSIFKDDPDFDASIDLLSQKEEVYHFHFTVKSHKAKSPEPITIRWRLPAFNVKGVWKCGGIHDKRLQYDWELVHLQSRISVDAPIVSVFGHDDTNVISFACSDAMNLMEMNALLREEDNHLYVHLTFFGERHPAITDYDAHIRVDLRKLRYAQAIQEIADWWASFEAMKPSFVPDLARQPLYSTWYNFHQDLDEVILLEECKIAADIGYKLIILDDGWQTMDNNRGYDYTGDWQPDRFPDLAGFVDKIHDLGMQFGLWFSVPFCGKKSKAYQRFKGKFLTEDHRWAPVFDPRYPEVREYLIGIYKHALETYGLDAFKLDFIDDFRVYPDTVLTKADGRDYANVNAAVDRLLTDVGNTLRAIKPDIAIEFRQQYIGPMMRKFGNMFRAFDCPNDAVSNRIRITDVKLLCGNTAVHSDPQTWHPEEPVELAALQVLNGFFGVPQMSVHLRHISEPHLQMVRFYTKYWNEHASILLDGTFYPQKPLSNYPILHTQQAGHHIIGVYEDEVVQLAEGTSIDLLNGKITDYLALRNKGETRQFEMSVWDCQGKMVQSSSLSMTQGIIEIAVPPAGMIRLKSL